MHAALGQELTNVMLIPVTSARQCHRLLPIPPYLAEADSQTRSPHDGPLYQTGKYKQLIRHCGCEDKGQHRCTGKQPAL